MVLENLGEPLGEGVLEVVLMKANYESQIHESAPYDLQRQLRLLKREYGFKVVDPHDTWKNAVRVSALEAML